LFFHSLGPDLVATAINQGYRLIDTAEFYYNEEGVGSGLKQSGKKREEVFIVSKWWPSAEGAKGALKSLEHCLKRFFSVEIRILFFLSLYFSLQSNYVDLYLLHAPQGGHCAEAYRALLDAKKQGKIR
jgi:2,5-diketo-D-gluconate reductase A